MRSESTEPTSAAPARKTPGADSLLVGADEAAGQLTDSVNIVFFDVFSANLVTLFQRRRGIDTSGRRGTTFNVLRLKSRCGRGLDDWLGSRSDDGGWFRLFDDDRAGHGRRGGLLDDDGNC